MQMRVEEIILKKRIRSNMGDITPLVESIKKHGLLSPIIVTSKHELIAGHRRLLAVKRLGWQTVEVKVLDNLNEASKIEIEIDENVHRRNLTADELADGYTRLDKIKNPPLFRRILFAVINFFRRLFRKKPLSP